MFNQKSIRSLCGVILMATILSICFNGLSLQKNKGAQASAISALTPISTFAIDETAGNTILSSVASDMDDNGNQIYVWSFTDSTSGEICNGIRYQRFQMSGLPLTSKSNAISNCSTTSNDHQYLNPSVAMDRTGDFVVAWTDLTSNSIDAKTQAFNSNNIAVGNPIIVEDSGSTMSDNAGVKVALNKNDDKASMHFGVTWLGCGTTPNCVSARNEERAQTFAVDFTGTQGPARVNSTNLILNPSPYEVSSNSPVIAFSNANFLVAWPGYNQTNNDANWAIFGRAITMDGNLSTNVFQLTSFNSREYNPSLAGIVRPIHQIGTSDIFYLSFSTDYLSGNSDIYAERITCSGVLLNCSSTSRANGDPIFVRANTSTSGQENLSTIRAFSNNNYTDKIYGQLNSSSDYLNITWCSYDSEANASKVYSQNFKNNLARAGTEITIDTLAGIDCPFVPSVAVDQDANYAISYINIDGSQIISKIYQSLYLRLGAENLIHAPDSNTFQGNPRTAINSNGNYVIAYENTNSNGYKDIVYVLYDKNGNAIQNSSIANSQTNGDHTNEDVAFFTDDSSSPDYGKFIITWHFDDNVDNHGIYYQLFNADGSKLGGETVVTTDQADLPKVSAGKFKQFLIVYRDGTDPNSSNSIQYLYQNNGTAIPGTATGPSTGIDAPIVTLSPDADGSPDDQSHISKFVIAWNTGSGNYAYREGYLQTANTVYLFEAQSGAGKVYDVSSAIVPALENMDTPKNAFMYAFVIIDTRDTQLRTYTYREGPLFRSIDIGTINDPRISTNNPRIAVDKATGNLLVSWEGFNDFTGELNPSQILMFTKDSHTVLNQGDHITGVTSGAQADIAANSDFQNNYYYTLSNATGPFTINETLSKNLDVPIAMSTPGLNIYFDHDISQNFFVGDTVTGRTSTDSGTVQAVYSNFIFVTGNTGPFEHGGEDLIDNNNNYQDTLTATDDAYQLDLTPNYSLPYTIGQTLTDITSQTTGMVKDISANLVNIANLTGTFSYLDVIRTPVNAGDFTPDIVGVIKAQFFRLSLVQPDGNYASITAFGPEFSPNTHFNYGQYLSSPDIDFDSRSSEDDGKFAIFSYNISGDDTYLDNNGVLQQMIEDPFSVGQKQDLSPSTNQQITPGGKYIVVPQLIDFGNIAHGTTSTVNFSDLTMPDASSGRLEVTDLDGANFDLTVSLSTLTNTLQSDAIIPNSNFVIENNDGTNTGGTNPGVTTSYSFTNVNDVTLDPSTNPGQNANLSTTQTLLRKTNNNTGVWDIYPRTSLAIPNDAVNGVYSATMTFTLI